MKLLVRNKRRLLDSLHTSARLLTAHKVVNHGVDSAVEIAQPVGNERCCHRVIVLRQFDCISAQQKRRNTFTKSPEHYFLHWVICGKKRRYIIRRLMDLSGEYLYRYIETLSSYIYIGSGFIFPNTTLMLVRLIWEQTTGFLRPDEWLGVLNWLTLGCWPDVRGNSRRQRR